MVTLLMRSAELGEKLSMGGDERQQKVLQGDKASSEVRTRARKGRNAQKKQPQRGLGVAQLEKLRLQEQSKLEAACFGLPPSFGYADQNGGGGICFRAMNSGMAPHPVVHHNSALSYCGGGRGPAEKLSHYDGDMLRTIISVAHSDHSTAGSFARGRGPLMLPRSRENMEHSYGCTSMRTVPSLASMIERPGSINGRGSSGTGGAYVAAEESSPGSKLPSVVVACPNSTAKSSLYSNAFTTAVNLVDSLASNVEQQLEHHHQQQQRLLEADRESVVHKFQVPNKNIIVGDAGVVDTKLFQPAGGKNGAGSLFTSNSIQCFEFSSGPAKLRRLSQDRTESPVVGVAINFGRPKELSSFQSFSSNNTWLATEKMCGQKRPWTDLDMNTSKLQTGLDLNAAASEAEVAQGGCNAGVPQALDNPAGLHDTSRNGLGCTLPLLKDKVCASWQETEVQNLSTTTDIGFQSGESFLKVSCAPQFRIKDCCSSVCSPCGSPVTRRRCLSSPEVPAMGVEHEPMLTLGIPRRSSPQYEVNSKESMSPEMGHQVKRVMNSEAEVDNSLDLQMSNRHQESVLSATGGDYSPSCTDNSFFSAVGLSCRFTSTSSSNMTDDCHKETGREEKREYLDLRLKLAL